MWVLPPGQQPFLSKSTNARPEMVKTRILIISDTHGASLEHNRPGPFALPLPMADLLIHCGDLTNVGDPDEYQQALDMLIQVPARVKLVIAGNHDLSLDEKWVLHHLENDARQPNLTESAARARLTAARHLWTAHDGRARQAGITFLDEGVHTISLQNGAEICVYASPYTPAFFDYGFAYATDEDRFNSYADTLSPAKNISQRPVPSRNEAKIDIMITHGPPLGRLDRTTGTSNQDVGCPHLLRAVMRARPRLHVFGHIHEAREAERVTWPDNPDKLATSACSMADWRAIALGESIRSEHVETKHRAIDTWAINEGKQTLFINAAIMDINYKPVNAPWVVDLELPKLHHGTFGVLTGSVGPADVPTFSDSEGGP